jgi:hypothetical protein
VVKTSIEVTVAVEIERPPAALWSFINDFTCAVPGR